MVWGIGVARSGFRGTIGFGGPFWGILPIISKIFQNIRGTLTFLLFNTETEILEQSLQFLKNSFLDKNFNISLKKYKFFQELQRVKLARLLMVSKIVKKVPI